VALAGTEVGFLISPAHFRNKLQCADIILEINLNFLLAPICLLSALFLALGFFNPAERSNAFLRNNTNVRSTYMNK
jgi:hypothetical protein